MPVEIYSLLRAFSCLFEWILNQFALRLLPKVIQQVRTRTSSSVVRGGSLAIYNRLPTEVLTEIFVHTCGDEYISIFNHAVSVTPSDFSLWFSSPEVNTVYVLKRVCKDWKELAEKTPRLWQRILFDFNELAPSAGRLPPAHHFEGLTTRILSKSAGRCLYLQVHGHERLPESDSNAPPRAQYLIPLFLLLVNEGHRWVSLSLSDIEPIEDEIEPLPSNSDEIYRTLEKEISKGSFPQLQRLTYHAANNTTHSIAPKLDFTASAPHLTNLILRLELSPRLGKIPEILHCCWGDLTSLVIDLEGTTPTGNRSSWASIIRPLVPVLQVVRQSLESLHIRGSSVYDTEPSDHHSRSFKTIGFPKLRQFVLEDTQALRLSHELLPRILCPALRSFELLLSRPLDDNKRWVPSVPHRLFTLQEFIASLALLQSFTLVQIPNLPYYEVRRDNPKRENEHIHHGYLVVDGRLAELGKMVRNTVTLGGAEDLCSILDHFTIPLVVSPPIATVAKGGLAQVLHFVPWTEYAPIPFVNRVVERPQLLPRRIMTSWEARHRHDRNEEEIENVGRLFLFSRSLWGKYRERLSDDRKAAIGALNAMDASSIMVLMHLFLMMSGSGDPYPCFIPSDCNIVLSVVV